MKKKFPDSFYNYTTLIGVAVSIISFGLILFLIVLESVATESKPYMGIIAFVVLPIFLITGLILIAVGAYRRSKKIKSGESKKFYFPKIDLNETKQFAAFNIFFVGTILLLMFTAFGSYKAYEYSDSDEFCGTICHEVMKPEYIAYQASPHAKVGCAKCHIGSGAEWFVKAKISGAHQVYSVLFNKFSRPIPTPIENLRPAQETCEQCHWPKHFSYDKQRLFKYYIKDENNSEFNLNMLIKIGGGNQASGVTSGIHWHMNIANEVEYIAIDEKRQIIPWVKVKNSKGETRIYKSIDSTHQNVDFSKNEKRKMDCIDCHNRPSHIYNYSSKVVNDFISLGWIDKNLPFIKDVSVSTLETNFLNSQNASDSIKILIEEYYKENYPKILVDKKESVQNAIVSLKKIYSQNYFPEMKVSWKAFPNNIGHLYSNGCFRCHDGKHISDDGKILTKDCNVCHSILSQSFENGDTKSSVEGINYIHPIDVGDEWNKKNCVECHLEKHKK